MNYIKCLNEKVDGSVSLTKLTNRGLIYVLLCFLLLIYLNRFIVLMSEVVTKCVVVRHFNKIVPFFKKITTIYVINESVE